MAYLDDRLRPLKSNRVATATRLVPVKQVAKAAYIEVASIVTPPVPQPGSPVNISVILKNTFVTAVDVACIAKANGQTIIDTTGQDKMLGAGASQQFNGQAIMPNGNLVIDAYSYFKDTSGQWEQDDHLQITLSAKNPAAKPLLKYSLRKQSATTVSVSLANKPTTAQAPYGAMWEMALFDKNGQNPINANNPGGAYGDVNTAFIFTIPASYLTAGQAMHATMLVWVYKWTDAAHSSLTQLSGRQSYSAGMSSPMNLYDANFFIHNPYPNVTVNTDTGAVTPNYIPVLTITNPNPKEGDTLKFSFTGFPPSSPITVTWWETIAGIIVGTATVNSDANGAGSGSFVVNVPAAPYTYTLEVEDSYGDFTTETFNVTSATPPPTSKPTLTITPSTVPQGNLIAVSVTGFTPNSPIELLVVETGGYWSETTDASGNGTWNNLGPIYDIVGPYTLQATDSQGITASKTYNVTAFTMPAGYTQIQDTLYPDAATYVGNAQVGIFTFTAPLTIIPGVDWIVQHMIDACVSAAKQSGTKMLELQVYSKPASLGSSDYIVSICVEDTAAVTYKRVVGLAPLLIAGIIAAIILIIAIAVTIVILSEAKLKWGGTVKSNTTTTTQAQTTTLTPGQSMVNTAPGYHCYRRCRWGNGNQLRWYDNKYSGRLNLCH